MIYISLFKYCTKFSNLDDFNEDTNFKNVEYYVKCELDDIARCSLVTMKKLDHVD